MTMAAKLSAAMRRYLAELGRKGGKVAAKNQTPEQRSQKARRAAEARWSRKAGAR